MLTAYISAAMARARYRIIDDETYFGEIPGLRGVWANAKTLEVCRSELQEVLEDWLVVYEGSTANLEEAPASKGTWVAKLRQSLVENKTLIRSNNVYLFTKNHIFNSPSAAAVAVLGRYANGWMEWKLGDGTTLDQEIRQK